MSNNNNESKVADEKSDALARWSNIWEEKKIGFHLEDVNPILTKYIENLIPHDDGSDAKTTDNTRVFVPLCGKTVDMAYLVAESSEVVGVEGIRVALQEFAQEQPELKIESKGVIDCYERFEGDKICLLKGDFFALDDSKTGGKFGAIYDRASIVAIDPTLRKAYIEIIGKLIAPGGKILLSTVERRGEEEVTKAGPPFSIPDDTVKQLFGSLDWVESITFLQTENLLETKPELKEFFAGLTHFMENVYLIQAK